LTNHLNKEAAVSAAPMPVENPARSKGDTRAWPSAKAPWAGLAIIAMWLAVLFVGLFGGDIQNSTPGGSTSAVPSAVALAVFALVGTIFVARWGFSSEPDVRSALEEERRARERLADEVARLGADVALLRDK
jgi:hypothetical protein